MTRYLLFKIVSIVLIFGILVGLCVLENSFVVDALSQMNDYCYEIEKAIAENDGIVNGEVASLVENMEYDWDKHEERLCLMVNHKSIESLGVEIVRLKTYIDEEEPIEFYVSLDIIKKYAETFQHFMGSSFHNIL